MKSLCFYLASLSLWWSSFCTIVVYVTSHRGLTHLQQSFNHIKGGLGTLSQSGPRLPSPLLRPQPKNHGRKVVGALSWFYKDSLSSGTLDEANRYQQTDWCGFNGHWGKKIQKEVQAGSKEIMVYQPVTQEGESTPPTLCVVWMGCCWPRWEEYFKGPRNPTDMQ